MDVWFLNTVKIPFGKNCKDNNTENGSAVWDGSKWINSKTKEPIDFLNIKESKMNKFESGCYYKRTKNTKASQENISYYKCVYTNDTQALLEFYNKDDKLVTTGLVPLDAEYFEKIERPIKKVKVGQVYTDEYGMYRYVLSTNGALATYLYTTSKGNQCVDATKGYNDTHTFGQYVEILNNTQEFFDKYVF